MKKITVRVLIGLVIFALPWSLAFAAEKTIRIGVLLPFTGALAKLGEEQFRGIELAKVIINEGGGIGGKKVEYVKADAPNPPAAISETERLITREKINIIIGTYASSLCYAASEVAERYGKIYFEVSALADNLTERGFKYFFRFSGKAKDYGQTGAVLAYEVVAPKLGVSPKDLKVAVIHEDTLFGTYIGAAAAKKALELGMKLVVNEAYSAKSLDLSSLVMKMQREQTDVVLQCSYLNDTILFYRQAKELNFNPKALIGMASAHGIEDFQKAFGKDANFVMLADENPMLNPKTFLPSLRPSHPEFIERYKKMWDRTPYIQGAMGYAGAMLLFQHVIPKVPSLEPEKLRKQLLSLDLPLGSTVGGFGAKFAPPGHPDAGQNLRALVVGNQWLDEQLVCVWPKQYAVRDPVLPMPTWEERKK